MFCLVDSAHIQRVNNSQEIQKKDSLSSQQLFEENLEVWVQSAPNGLGEWRDVAAERIREAYYYQSSELNLSRLHLSSLPEGVFSALPRLETLDLCANQLSILSGRIFQGLEKLYDLNLGFNQLHTLPEDVFDGLILLTNVSFHSNKLSSLPEKIFSNLVKLRFLNLGSNQLTSLPDCIFDSLIHLERLNLHSNRLSTCDTSQFFELKALKHLNLGSNQLRSLSENCFKGLSNLEFLFLDGNQLMTLPPRIFSELGKLRNLNLESNQLNILMDKTFCGLNALKTLNIKANQLSILSENVLSALKNLQAIELLGNPFIFKPEMQIFKQCRVTLEDFLQTEEDELFNGNHNILNFNVDNDYIPGTIDARGLLKLELMLMCANKKIKQDIQFACHYSSALNQLFYYASTLSKSDPQNKVVCEQADALLTSYLSHPSVKEFAQQAESLGFDISQYEGLLFLTENGTEGLTFAKECYEAQVLEMPSMDEDSSNATLEKGVLVHKTKCMVDGWPCEEDIKPFTLLNKVYFGMSNKQGISRVLNSINMGAEYTKHFIEALSVLSVGVLVRQRERREVGPIHIETYKMVDAASSNRLLEIFFDLIEENEESSIGRLANPKAQITDKHFEAICQAFPTFSTTQTQAALLFNLSLIFTKYSSQAFFGTDTDSPAVLRFYAHALLNKVKVLDTHLFIDIKGDALKEALLGDECADTLSSEMQVIATAHPVVMPIYVQVMPKAWQ